MNNVAECIGAYYHITYIYSSIHSRAIDQIQTDF